MKWKVASTYNPPFKTTRAIAMHSQSHTPAAHKIRSACDICHKAKMKCSRGKPCVACSRSGNECRYSVSNRLGRPPKGTTATIGGKKMIDLSGTSKEQVNQPTVMASDLFGGDTSQGEDLLTLDDMFMDTFSDSSYTHSGPETPPDHVFSIMGETMNDISLMKDNLPSWPTGLDLLRQSPVEIRHHESPRASSRLGYTNKETVFRCDCLQQQTRFLCRLKELDRTHTHWASAITLDVAKETLRVWQDHLKCQSCWKEGNNTTLMLSVVSFDMVAKRLWRFLAHPPHHGPLKDRAEGGPPDLPHRMGTSKARTSEPGADLITANSDAGGSTEQHSPRAGSSISISVGEFRVPEEEQVFVIGMLIIRILRRIREGLDEARGRVARGLVQYEKNERFGVPPTNSLAALMLENIYGSLGVLEQSLRGFVLR
ncbi:hypothetical protein F4809DRAFT_627501 [Biscogniauxia mediterranea]|nr:hypothetical protein F4809DRAFT_627501 [Biscogniauxia mediterranea]